MKPLRFRWHFRSQNGGLAKPAKAIGAEIAAKVGKPGPKRLPKAWQARRADKGTHDAQGRVIKVFGKVKNRSVNRLVDGMTSAIRRKTQRGDLQPEACALQPMQFLCDERFG